MQAIEPVKLVMFERLEKAYKRLNGFVQQLLQVANARSNRAAFELHRYEVDQLYNARS